MVPVNERYRPATDLTVTFINPRHIMTKWDMKCGRCEKDSRPDEGPVFQRDRLHCRHYIFEKISEHVTPREFTKER